METKCCSNCIFIEIEEGLPICTCESPAEMINDSYCSLFKQRVIGVEERIENRGW